MWHRDQERFCTQHNLTPGDTQFLQCTAEHLVARKDGGGDDAANIAAAHLICNRGRHQRKKPLEVDRYRMLVRTRVREGRWHQPQVLRALGVATTY